MNDIIFKDCMQLVSFFRKCDRELGYGTEGCCYKYGNMSYKLYNNASCIYYNNSLRMNKLLKFESVLIDNIYFIRCLLFLQKNLIGVGSCYAPGLNCETIHLHRKNIDKITNALEILKKNIYELSLNGIYISDLGLSNILYNDKVFSLIDTVDYYYSGDKKDDSKGMDSVDTIYRKNMDLVMRELFKGITNANMHCDNFILAYLTEKDSIYKDYLVDIDMLLNPVDTIIGIKKTIEEEIGREINSFSNCRKDLLRIRKK